MNQGSETADGHVIVKGSRERSAVGVGGSSVKKEVLVSCL